ncbi:PEP/pyruvate-binding domain-containing protein [Crossiella sp. CA-258035]|uniref:PEP/pyruvate-binding domain-containing protein n=1 Tax=Crossiella sp. CA-258035 TaxID=2981138 RepID=UPI0024BCF57A|nr:PEP/pyruvate-binding domain-containing protein [Crossiella sp. CA-258035]WHT17172.1 PEP/pyruvate-binding domain-containing protein [Crossiella sp. CA-258035]
MSVGVVLPLGAEQADLHTVGGKGESLATLVRAGVPVPPGFHVSTAAYRGFVAGGLDQTIRAALRGEPEDASAAIAAAFERVAFPASTASAILTAYAELGSPAVAVRSSATAEDLPGLSFAGQQDSFLNVTGEEALLDAVRRCWASLWTARAIGYRARHGVTGEHALAVVVQELVPAEAAGVLFTANPLTGAGDEILINAAWGLGESVVGGQVTPDSYVLRGDRVQRQVADKTVRTVRVPGGTRDEPVPTDLRWLPVLTDEQARELAALGRRIHELYRRPTDIEWAWHDGRFAILQARPITTVLPETWNDSLRGDYLWTSANLGEAVPSVMTPATWSLAQAVSLTAIGGHPMSGNIGGRFYLNLSLSLGMADALGVGRFARRANEHLLGRIDEDPPRLPESRLTLIRLALRTGRAELRAGRELRKRLPELLATGRQRCRDLRARIAATDSAADLAALWDRELAGLLADARLLSGAARTVGVDQSRVRARLERLAEPAEVTALLSGAHGAGGELASLGPVLGLAELRAGRIDRDTFADTWGHRGPDEFEVSSPRPAEDPAWIDRQLATLGTGEQDPSTLLARQAQTRQAAWHRLRTRHPRQAAKLTPTLDKAARAARRRELARSEFVRAFWVFRAFILRAGELTGHGEDLFFLPLADTVRVLRGDPGPLGPVPARRAAYQRYRALPPYPTIIRGHFDPETWAADPNRRIDRYDARDTTAGPAAEGLLRGFGGVAGVVEGAVRILRSVEDGEQLRPGEILVTTVTNVGWTPLFPRAAAVVTDVGAPLSHAAIVARELGIPAVVGCGEATTRLRTGDRVRVDGGQGTVTLLPPTS